MDLIREKIYCECIGAPKQGDNKGYKFGWSPNKFGLEPASMGATTYIHFDAREMTILEEYFIKNNDDKNFNKQLNKINN